MNKLTTLLTTVLIGCSSLQEKIEIPVVDVKQVEKLPQNNFLGYMFPKRKYPSKEEVLDSVIGWLTNQTNYHRFINRPKYMVSYLPQKECYKTPYSYNKKHPVLESEVIRFYSGGKHLRLKIIDFKPFGPPNYFSVNLYYWGMPLEEYFWLAGTDTPLNKSIEQLYGQILLDSFYKIKMERVSEENMSLKIESILMKVFQELDFKTGVEAKDQNFSNKFPYICDDQ